MRACLLLFLVACQEQKVGTFSTPPVVNVLSPESGAVFNPGDVVELRGEVGDEQTDAVDLAIAWTSDLDSVLDETPSDGDGTVVFSTASLSSGTHTITLTATDEDAEVGSESVAVTVLDAPAPDEDAPAVVILSPTSADVIYSTTTVNVLAAATDGEDAYDTLAAELIDVPDGTLWTGSPTSTGSITVPATFTVGTHLLTLTAADSDGNVATTSVTFEVLDDGRPRVTIDAPADGDVFDVGELVSFRGTVSDDLTDVELLGVTWESDVSGVLGTNPPDSSGAVSTATALAEGYHTVTLTALDGDAKTGSDSIVIKVEDPLARDDDGDGYSENDGDCDDADATVSPGEPEACDEVDNDCDGSVNEDWWDGYEANDTMGASYDCGEVDNSTGWSNSTLELSSLTLSAEDDEDWFVWDADDDWYDNVSITVAATGFTARGTYVVELYDGDGNIRGSDSGSGSLSIDVEGDPWEDGEDTWYLRVYATTWPSGSCDVTYDLRIHS